MLQSVPIHISNLFLSGSIIRLIKIVFMLGLYLSTTKSVGQSPLYYPVIPSNLEFKDELYNVFQDSRGFIWIGSDNGVFRYDGKHVDHFTLDDGLTGLDIMNVSEDKNGLIWFYTYKGGICYFDYITQTIATPKQNIKLIELLGTGWIDELCIEDLASIWAYDFNPSNYKTIGQPIKSNIYHILPDTIIVYNALQPFSEEELNKIQSQSVKQFIQRVHSYKTMIPIFREINKLSNGSLLGFRYQDAAWQPSPQDSFKTLGFRRKDIEVIDILENHQQKLLFLSHSFIKAIDSTQLDVCRIVEDSFHSIQNFALPISTNEVYQDKQDRYWFPSNEEGLWICPNLYTYRLDHKQHEQWSCLELKDSTLWAIGSQGVFKDMNVHSQPKFVAELFIREASPSLFHATEDYVYVGMFKIYLDKVSKKYKEIPYLPAITIKAVVSLTNNELALGHAAGFKIIDQTTQEELYNSQKDNFFTPVYAFANAGDTLWLGTKKGVYFWNKQQGLRPILEDVQVNDIRYSNQLLAIATQDKGIIILRDNQPFLEFNTRNGLGDNQVNIIKLEGDSIAWVGTQNGLQKIVFPKNTPPKVFPIINKLKITDIESIKDSIYCIANNQIIFFDKKEVNLQPTILPPFYLKSVSINNKNVPLKLEYELERYQNNISIELQHLNIDKLPDHILYKLEKVGGTEQDWQILSSMTLKYPDLNSGDWTLSYTTQKQLQQDNPKIKTVRFFIAKPVTESIWFWALLSLLASGSVLFIATLYTRRQKYRLNTKKRLVELELNLLRAQMNPHFIYNAMNSILGYIMRKDTLTTANYFSRFSKLMRNIMENTRHPFIQLEKEFEALELYLELEQLRLGDKHKCFIEITEELRYSDIKIPPMLIQPFVENAILHGITPLKKGGLVTIIFTIFEDKYLKVIIEDNGIGREKAEELKKKRIHQRQKSLGLSNSKERIHIINNTYKMDIQLRIDDLKVGNEVTGTRITLLFPVNVSIEQDEEIWDD
ncbi:MAG: histidine kinase [Saprospiraceae bacterium]|nr:histidine kinase [Saprospiraceae bacterium]